MLAAENRTDWPIPFLPTTAAPGIVRRATGLTFQRVLGL